MSYYIGLVLCTDGTVARAPRFSSIKKGDQIVIGDEIHDVDIYTTIDRESEDFYFIRKMYDSEIFRADAILWKNELKYPEDDDGSAV